MKNQRGQAAMEFLMTYGWTILAAIIAIAILAYFGVFNPGQYTSDYKCLSEKFCEKYDSVLWKYQNDPEIYCKTLTSKGDFYVTQYLVDFEELKVQFPDCTTK